MHHFHLLGIDKRYVLLEFHRKDADDILTSFCRSLCAVLMLHGPSGVGKNHISRLLARSMFTNGVESRFVNYYSSSRHFREADKVEEYRSTLDHEIKSNLTVCDTQLFIFDEARRFPPKLLDSLAPFFDPGTNSCVVPF